MHARDPVACKGRLRTLCLCTCLQDPAYPVYVDSSVIMGMTGDYNAGSTGFDGIQYMPCSPDNDFFPDLSKASTVAVQQPQSHTLHAATDASNIVFHQPTGTHITSFPRRTSTCKHQSARRVRLSSCGKSSWHHIEQFGAIN